MARPERHDVDYFPFIAKRGRTLNILQSRYGLEGIGFFTNLLRFLAITPDHYYCIKEESDRMNFFTEIGLMDEKKGIEMIELMVKTEKLDKDLWENNMVIACPVFLESLKDAYKQRKNQIITIEEIREKFQNIHGNPQEGVVSIPDNSEDGEVSSGDNTQTKLKDSIVKDNILNSHSENVEKEKPKKPPLREREPENDYERVEKAYIQNWETLYAQNKVTTPQPIVNWTQTRKLLKNHFAKLKPEQIILAINNGLKDDFVITAGYSLAAMLSATVLNRLLNAKPRHRISNDNLSEDDVSKYFSEA